MKTRRVAWSSVFFVPVFTFGMLLPQFAQDNPANAEKAEQNSERRALLIGFVRTINTDEVTESSKYGSYGSWPTLLEHQADSLNGWVARFYPQGANLHFAELPNVLPGWSLRLNAHGDGQGYDLLVEDTTDNQGYTVQSDERGVIRECKPLQ
jgi:hypothetical protein